MTLSIAQAKRNHSMLLNILLRLLTVAVMVLPLAGLVTGCATTADKGAALMQRGWSWRGLTEEIRLTEPSANELVVVINHNAPFGNHAGLFAGARLSDPAGSYRSVRSRLSEWREPSLGDYVAYQLTDGWRIQIYRFELSEQEFSAVLGRLPEADRGMPLFCGAAVQNAIAGIGPFQRIPATWWTSPAALADRLDALLGESGLAGVCLRVDGTMC